MVHKTVEIEITIITIVNNMDVYREFLQSLNTQKSIYYEVKTVFNCNHEYSSARKAYNEAAEYARGKYLFFVHPDIRFLDELSLADIMVYVRKIDEFGVIGAAGAIQKGKKREIITSIVHGDNAMSLGTLADGLYEVQTVDECFFIVERKYFISHVFPETEGWHLYAVQYCLEAIKDARKNYVVPVRVWHLSDGKSLDYNYVNQLEQLIKVEKNDFDMICTTVRAWRTKGVMALVYRKYYVLKQYIKGKFYK